MLGLYAIEGVRCDMEPFRIVKSLSRTQNHAKVFRSIHSSALRVAPDANAADNQHLAVL